MKGQPLLERFWSKVDKSGECWLWTGAEVGIGYGRFYPTKNVGVLAHRFSWALVNGEAASGFEVMHKCDTPGCVRPDHLTIGTHADNMADCAAKGRAADSKGEKNPWHRLTLEQVREIRSRIASGEVQRRLAQEYEVSRSTICAVNKGQNWSWAR